VLGKVDLEWDDAGVIPQKLYPDTTFVFTRMEEETIGMVSLVPGEIVLDIGCGRALDAMRLAREGGKAVGLEPSRKMIALARGHIGDGDVSLVRGIGEALPFKKHSLDKVMCKGSLDHFVDPEESVAEMHRVLKPEGEVVIALANFSSLGCRLGRLWYPVGKKLPFGEKDERQPWQPPPDHTYKFDYQLLRRVVAHHFEVKRTMGISLLWQAPFWGKTLALLPRWISQTILALGDRIARRFPSMSDVIVIKCTPKV
jgi:ubiquinone/menaquinone biosynthesis C-methylase UbiE